MRTDERLKTIYETATRMIVRNESAWKDFLSFAARIHKYSFDNALLVYAQNPNITTLASLQQWNKVGRKINRGEKGIAVCEYKEAKLTLSYLFDISQTYGKELKMTDWQLDDERKKEIAKRLIIADGLTTESFSDTITALAVKKANEQYEGCLRSILANSQNHIFSELPQGGLEAQLISLITDSTAYVVGKKCGLADEEIILEGGMDTINDFNRISLIAPLGNTVTSCAKEILIEMELTIKTINAERTANNERQQSEHHLHGKGRDTVPEPANIGRTDGRPTSRQIRENGTGVSERKSPTPLYSFENGWFANGGNAQGSADGNRENRAVNSGNAQNRPRTEHRGHAGTNTTFEQSETVSRGNGNQGVHSDTEVKTEKSITAEPSLGGSVVLSEETHTPKMSDDEIKKHYENILTNTDIYPIELHRRLYLLLKDEPDNALWEGVSEDVASIYAEYGNREYNGEVLYRTELKGNDGISMYFGDGSTYLPWIMVANIINAMIVDGDYTGDYKELFEGARKILVDAEYVVSDEYLWTAALELEKQKIYNPTALQIAEQTEAIIIRDAEEIDDNDFENVMAAVEKSDTPTDDFTEETANVTAKPKRATAKRDMASRNYRTFAKLFPDIISGKYTDLILSAGDSFDPLEIHKKDGDIYSLEHYWMNNGDAMYDPYMLLKIDNENKTINAVSYENSGMGVFQEVYTEKGYYPQLLKELNSFLNQWLTNISYQGYKPVKAIELVNGAERSVDLTEPQTAQLDLFSAINEGEQISFDTAPPTVSTTTVIANITEETAETDETEVEEIPETPVIKAQNFRYSEDYDLYPTGSKTKFKANISAIKTLKTIESEHRTATPEEQVILARYVGWGGISNAFNPNAADWKKEYEELKILLTDSEYKEAMESTLTAYYTEPELIKRIYGALDKFGFEGGKNRRLLDPAMGTGNFFSVMPEHLSSTKLYGVEIDSITGRIAKLLYPNAEIHNVGYEETQFEDNSFDVAIGNIPFNNITVYDRRYKDYNFHIHDYFFAKSLDLVKPGGIIAFITSKGTMDKRDSAVREYIAERADFIGAIRLPDNAFKKLAGTEVTADIIFLKKREQKAEFYSVEDTPIWIDTISNQATDWMRINNYFVMHPEMILGEMQHSSRMYGNEDGTTCTAPEGFDLYGELERAIGNLTAEFSAEPDTSKAPIIEIADDEPTEYEDAPDGTKNFTFVVKDDKIYYCERDKLIPQPHTGKKAERIKGLCGIRTALLDVINIQSGEYEESELKEKQRILNNVYDTFVKKYGAIGSFANIIVFSDDDQFPLLRSIENEIDEDGKKRFEKSQIFYKATIHPPKIPTRADTAEEALYISLNTKLRVDIRYMSQLCRKSPDEVINELGEKIYLNPYKYNGNILEGWETAEEYLSGQVKDKLVYAESMAEEYPELFSRNVTALEAAQPKPLLPTDIHAPIGAPWIDLKYYQQFMYELFDTSYEYQYLGESDNPNSCITLNYMEYTTVWRVLNKFYERDSVKVNQTYGTSRKNAYEIFEDCLNQQITTVKDRIEYTDDNGEKKEKYVVNPDETRIARAKQTLIKEEFAKWLWKDERRREDLLSVYNNRFNTVVPRVYDGSHLVFPGMSAEMQLRPHQKNFAARVIYSGTGLAAHEVGAGKTAALIAAGMYLKNIGAIKKPVYVVPNPLVGQWATEFYRFYPNANILVSTVNDFTAKNRNRFVSRIAMGDYDAVILAHSQFERIPISTKRQIDQLDKQIREITYAIDRMKAEKGENWSVKQMVAFQKNLNERLKRLSALEKKDDLLTFEQLGIDFMFVDEAHLFKNCFIYTKMSRVSGINTSSSQRAFDMLNKCQYLQEINNNRGVVFATGTPVSNSMTELFVMMRYLEPKELERQGLSDFDSWAATYGEIVSSLEITPEGGGYRMRQRFAKFHNLPELMRTYRLVADVQTAETLKLPRPEIYGGKKEVISAPATEYQKKIMATFVERAEDIRNGCVEPYEDNMLKLTGEARQMAIDPRLIDDNAPNDPNSKLNLCINQVYKIWKETEQDRLTQLVFCDVSTPDGKTVIEMELIDGVYRVVPGQFTNAYDEIKKVLVDRGVPENEIVFIHEAKTEAQRQDIFEKMRKGEIRILLGSTGKLGTGVNVQDRVIALHHLDVPWKPSDIIQRDGRGLRQGNINPAIRIYHYVAEGTFDAYLWQIQEQKLRFITQISTAKNLARSCEDIDETVLTAAQFKAVATDNPKLLEKMELENRVSELRILQRNHQEEQMDLERKIKGYYPREIERANEEVEKITEDVDLLDETEGQPFIITLEGKVYDERVKAGQMLLAISGQLGKEEFKKEIGKYRGFTLYIEQNPLWASNKVTISGAEDYTFSLGDSDIGNITRLENMVDGIKDELSRAYHRLQELQKQFETAQEQFGTPFLYADELVEKSAKLTELDTELELGKGDDMVIAESDGENTEDNEYEATADSVGEEV